jgi:hypothetical protein
LQRKGNPAWPSYRLQSRWQQGLIQPEGRFIQPEGRFIQPEGRFIQSERIEHKTSSDWLIGLACNQLVHELVR